jgi:hypothetical protein
MTDESYFFDIVGTDTHTHNHYCISCGRKMERCPEKDMLICGDMVIVYWCRSCDLIRWYPQITPISDL